MTAPSTPPAEHADQPTGAGADPVTGSVRAYSEHAGQYAAANAAKMAGEVAAFIAALPAGARVLDAGCGPGRDLARFAAAGLHPVGIDLNPDFVAQAAGHAPVTVADLRSLPLDEATVDAVWACASLVHLPPADAAIALGELARVARAGAPVHVSVKAAGPSGWVDTPHGRRWYYVWDPQEFAHTVAATGLLVDRVHTDAVFVNVTAHA